MDKRPPKCKGGAEKLQEKKIKNLQADSSKISDMFGAVVASSTSALPEVEEGGGGGGGGGGEVAGYTEKQKQHDHEEAE